MARNERRGLLGEVRDVLADEQRVERYRTTTTESGAEIPFDRIVLDPDALVFAADQYAEQTGDVDELALASAVLLYLESSKS